MAATIDSEEQVRLTAAAQLRACQRAWPPGELRDLDLRIADAIVVATLRTGRSWAELRERHRTVFQTRLVVPPEQQRAADELVEREGIEAVLERAAAAWLTTTMDLVEFNRGVLGVIDPPPDVEGRSATP